jgi:hypothetical protein
VHYAELRSFAAEISQTVENDRENFSIASPALLVPRQQPPSLHRQIAGESNR